MAAKAVGCWWANPVACPPPPPVAGAAGAAKGRPEGAHTGDEVAVTAGPLAAGVERAPGETVDSCSWISIMWSPRRMVRLSGALPERKSFTCNAKRIRG